MNVQPKTKNDIVHKLQKMINRFDGHRKTSESKRGPDSKWMKDQEKSL